MRRVRPGSPSPLSQPSQLGFSLVELMVVLAIGLVIATAAIPALGSVIRKTQAKHAQSDLIAAARLAQSEARRRGQDVTVAPDSSCTAVTDQTFNWGCNWRVFLDADGDHSFQPDQGDALIRLYSAPSELAIGSNGGYIVYNPNGTTTNLQTLVIGASQTVKIAWARIG